MTIVEIYEAEPTSLVAVTDQCMAIETWAAQCDSIPELKDWKNKLAAVDEYLARTSTEGRARVAATMRRLEVRIGELLGPPEEVKTAPGRNASTASKVFTADQ